jgi:DNA-binding response OmpR family regulator
MIFNTSPLVFVVEDDPVYSKVIERNLTKNGHTNLKLFVSGEDALDSINDNPDFVLLDFSLGGLNGLDTLQKIKAKKSNSKVVVLTGVTDEALAAKCLANGALLYIEKNDHSFDPIIEHLNAIQSRKKLRNMVIIGGVLLLLAAYFLI